MGGDLLTYLLWGKIEEATYYPCKCNTWGVKWAGIGIQEPTQRASTNFDMSKHCCYFPITFLFNKGAMDLRTHATQVREGNKPGRKRRFVRDEENTMPLKVTVGSKAKRKQE